jgi:aminobenzoyl-glutamate utilization protein B
VIAILGEFDALPGLSQAPGVAEHRPLEEGGNGHGCGHNLLGAAALLAATAVKDWLAENGLRARVRYYGCPAEEGGAAKTYMVREGLFDDVDAAISWHPATFTAVNSANSLANTRIDFTFHGKAAHAAGAPELGRSALDAVELMNVGVNYLREHMPDDARVHYAYLDAGGVAPNVVQARATVRQLIRARDLAGPGRPRRAGAQDRRGRGADDRDAGRDPGVFRRLEPARQPPAGRGDAGRARPARPGAVRRRGPGICRRDPEDPDPDEIAASFRRIGRVPPPTLRSAISWRRSTGPSTVAKAPPMWAM